MKIKFSVALSVLGVFFLYSCRTTSDSSVKVAPTTAHNIKKVSCLDASGKKNLVIERSINELPFPTYHIKFINGEILVVSVEDAGVKRDNSTSFMVQKLTDIDQRQGIEVSAGINWSENGQVSGFYMEAANEGASPLPGAEFTKCEVEEFGALDSIAVTERNIQKIVCLDASGKRKLEIERSINELPFPTFNLKFLYQDKVQVSVGDAGVTKNTASSFAIQKITDIDHRQGIEVSAGVNWSGDQVATGYYMEAANEGASPLPGMGFTKCDVTEY